MRRDEIAVGRGARKMHPGFLLHARDMRVQPLLGLGVDHRADMGGGIARDRR